MMVFAFSWRGRTRRINRWEGGFLLLMFFAYTLYMISVVVASRP